MAGRTYLSIGEVLVTLKTEFPDITISKIRFLEGEGLIDPERTTSGYRKFYESDVSRLRAILRLQRDEYLPLKVIKERLARADDGPEVLITEGLVRRCDDDQLAAVLCLELGFGSWVQHWRSAGGTNRDFGGPVPVDEARAIVGLLVSIG